MSKKRALEQLFRLVSEVFEGCEAYLEDGPYPAKDRPDHYYRDISYGDTRRVVKQLLYIKNQAWLSDDSPVPMPVHQAIEEDANDENISLIVQLLDWMREDQRYALKIYDENHDVAIIERIDSRKLALEFFEYDYEAWLQEKEDLVKWLNEQNRKGAN